MTVEPSLNAPARNQREHHWDALRAFLMLLGIPYHTALSYRPAGKEWIVNSGPGGATGLTYLAEFLHLFRMPAFFVIAGYFAAMLLARRSPKAWVRGRWRRVGVPFAFSIVTFVPLMNMACELSNLPLTEAVASWVHNSLTSAGYWIRHLWFVIILLYCSTAAAAVAWCFPKVHADMPSPRIDGWVSNHFVTCLLALSVIVGLWEAGAVELFYKAGLATNIPQELLRIDELIMYGPYFLIGHLVSRSPGILQRVHTFSPAVTLIAVVSIAVHLVYLDDFSPWTGRFIATFASIATTQVIIAAARRVTKGPHKVIDKLVAASFAIYLVHMPIIVILVALAARLPWPVVDKALAVMLLSLVLSYAAWLVIARSRWLSFAFNGDPLPPKQRQPSFAC